MRAAGLRPDEWDGDREGTLETMSSKDGERPAKADGKKAKATASAAPAPTSKDDPFRAGKALGSLFTKALIVALIGLGGAALTGSAMGDGFRRFSYAYLTAYMWGLSIVRRRPVLGDTAEPGEREVERRAAPGRRVDRHRRTGDGVARAADRAADLHWQRRRLRLGEPREGPRRPPVLHHKAAYLNPTFFLIRFVVYFGFWTLLSRFFLKQSLEQDRTGAPDIVGRMRKVAGPGMIGFALTVTFCAIDLMMSLDPLLVQHDLRRLLLRELRARDQLEPGRWSRLWLHKQGPAEEQRDRRALSRPRQDDVRLHRVLGLHRLLAVHADLVREPAGRDGLVSRSASRAAGATLSYALLILPLRDSVLRPALAAREAEHRRRCRSGPSGCSAMIYLDMFWLIMPQYADHPVFGVVEILALVGVSGAVVAAVAFAARNVNLVPVKDPRLERSLAFENI